LSGCGKPEGGPGSGATAPDPHLSAPQIPEDVRAAAEAALGNEAEALAWGDLALNGKQQVLVINRLHKPNASLPGIVFTRLTILENDAGKWKQVLLCDEHLKNPNGFLAGTPSAGITTWRLQFEQNHEKGLLLFLTPFEQGPAIRVQSIEVRWNPSVKRYQALDMNYENFLGEAPALEEIRRELK
jgi:hypothetical protein